MKQSRKLLSVLLALVLAFSLLPGSPAQAEEPPETYKITVNGGRAVDQDGALLTEAAPDTVVFLEAEIPEGHYLKDLTIEPEDLQINPDGSFNMPACDVTISFNYVEQQKVVIDLTEGGQTLTDPDALGSFLWYWEEDFEDGAERSYDLDDDGTADIKVSYHVTEIPDPEDPDNPDKVTKEYSAEFEALDSRLVSGEVELSSEELPHIFTIILPEITYTVSFDANGGTGAMPDMTVKQGEKLTLPDCGFTPPPDKEFDKWDAGAPGEKIDVNENMTIKAIWKGKAPDTCLVTFDPDGGTGSMASRTVKKGAKLTLPDCEFTPPEGKTFDKWDVGSPGEQIEVTGDMVVKAVWKWLNYTVTFETDGGSIVPTQVIQHGNKANKPVNPTKEGYSFEGWFTDKECKNAFDFDTPITGNITLYAKWKEVVTYEVVEGAFGSWTKGSKVDKRFVIKRTPNDDQCFPRFKDVLINGKTLTKDKDYTAEAGSTVVTIKAAALQKLPAGTHTITFVFNDGQAGAKLTVRAGTGGPRTGDESTAVWVALLAVSGVALCGGGAYWIIRKRRQDGTNSSEG